MQNQALKFYQLKYDVSVIEDMIDLIPDINNFVFSYYSVDPGKAMQLIAYVRTGLDCTDYAYSDRFNILEPFGYSVLELNGPVILSNNFISIATMKTLIGYVENGNRGEPSAGYLLFTPAISDTKHVYYTVQAYLGNLQLGKSGDSSSTNPSPPATMPV